MLYLDRLLSYNPDSSPFKNNTSLKTVTVGNGVAHLPAGLFNGCSNLQSIITSNLKVNVDENAFDKASFQNLWVNGCTPDDAIALAGSSAWAPFTHLGYREGDEQYAPIVCREPLTLTGTTYYTNTNGALVLPNRRLTVTASSEPIGKVMFRNQEVSGQITSAEGFTFKSTSCWKENIFYSQDAASGKSRTIEMTKAGDLIRLLGLSDAKNVENLTIIGVINGTDVLAINNMPQLRYLDLSRANIVEGGSAYRDNLKTQNNVVGSYFFHALENIEMVFLPETATRIETHVLDGKSTLRSVVMGNSLLSIGQKAFSGCSSLFNVTLPEKVSSIGSSAFSGCTGLTSITIPAGVNTIGESAFSGCTGLTSITIPASVNTIGESAFYLCTDLVSVTVENKETSLKLVGNSSNLFSGCSIETLYLGRDIAGTGSPFKNSTSLKTLTFGEKVTAIIPSMFSGCTGLTSITIPAGVNTIGESAFSGCTGLTSITIPASVNTIGESAFYLCTDLVSVTVENKETSLKLVGNSSNLFSGCSIETLYLGRDIAGTGSPFKNSTSLKTLTFGEKVTAIIPSMFSGCTGLTSITIPDQVTSIGSSAFSDCTGLTSITIPASVNTIGESAFSGCTGLTNVTAEDGKSNLNLEGNPGNLFSGNNIETLYLGRNIAGTASPFKNNTSLKKLTLGNKVTTIISSMFSGCTGLTSVTIPDQVTSIGSSAFWGCASLQDAVIGSGVKEIGALVFRGCNHLTNLALGENVSSIANDAFYGCSAITKIISLNPEPPQISFDVFEDVDKSVCKLIVCSGCMGYYWLVPAWKEFINMSEEDMVVKSDKAYKIKCGRGYWKTQDDRHVKIVNDESDADLYAFIKRNNFVYYIYNVTEKKFLCKESGDAVFSNENLEEIDAIYFHETGNSNYPVYFTNQNNHYFNVNGSSYLVVNSWSTLDDGNQFALIEAADFDAEALSEAQRILSGEKEQITLADLPRAKYGDAPIDLTAGFPEGVTLKFESSNTNVARINGTMLQIVGAGKATITTSVPEGDKTIEIISGQERQLVVDKASLSITAKSYTITAGDAMPEFKMTVSGFVNNETSADIDELPVMECTATDTNTAGEYEIRLTGGSDNNYNIACVNGTLTINKKKVSLDALPRVTYGDTPIDLTAGLPEGITLKFTSSNTNVARVNGTMLQIVGAGKATITTSVPEGGMSVEITNGVRQLVVDKANLTVTAKSYEINAGNAMPTFELLFDGFVNGDTQADIDKLPTITCSATDTNMPGEFEICLTGGTDDNYNLSLVTGKLTIHKMDGIEQIGLEPEYDVYNLHGVKLMTKATKKDLKRLTPGIYIINGKKVVIK